MRKVNLLLLLVVVLSLVVKAALEFMPVYAEEHAIELIDKKNLDLHYIYEEKAEVNAWQLIFNRQSEREEEHQLLKFKITDEKDHVIDYPEFENMVEKDGWLVEKDFSVKREDKLSLHLSKSIKRLNLYVQMDQKRKTSDSNEVKEEIQENILERKTPYVLNSSKKETTFSTTDASGKEEEKVTVSSEKFIGPKKDIQKNSLIQTQAARNVGSRMYSPLYTNKETKYKNDAGTYPEFSWKPTGQSNVINHQGGNSGQTGWDGVNSWDVANDDHTQTYIKYGDDSSNPNIQLRKYAQQTDEPDEFKIKLNVRGNTIYKPGVDIVFLLDNTGSMASNNKKTNSLSALEKIITELKKEADPTSNAIRVGAHVFASYDPVIEEPQYGWKRENTHFQLSNDPTDWEKIKPAYKKILAEGGTFTQRGLQEAADIMNDPSTDIGEERYKLLFMLTDGAPNASWEPLTAEYNSAMYYDPVLITSFNSGTSPNYLPGKSLGAIGINTKFESNRYLTVNGQMIRSHLTTTNSTAQMLKDQGIEMHSIAVQITSPGSPDHSAAELRKGLYRLSTKKATATGDEPEDYFYYHATDPTELTERFKDWYQTIIRTVDKGIVTDPLGDMVELVTDNGKGPKVTQVSNGAPLIEDGDKPNISIENSNRQIKVDNINLTRNQEIELEYTVRLKVDDPTFVSNQWYPTNNETILRPTPERTNDRLEFGRPSVKFQKADFTIPVEKIWSDTHKGNANYWKLRSDKVTVTLQKQNGSNWQDVESIDLEADKNWKGNFSQVEGGEANTYRVIEPNRTAGYKQPTVNQASFTSETMISGGIKITNELLRGNHQFWKFMEDESTKFTDDLPKFSVKRSDGKIVVENLSPNGDGKVALNDLPIGDYIVEETYVPVGFQKMDDLQLEVRENNPPTSLNIKVNGRTDDYHAINQLKDFSVKVEKIDPIGDPLTGAVFKLTGPNGYEETISTGSTFNFTSLRPGSYTLEEIDNPEGYQRIQDPIVFVINQDGSFTVNNHPNVSDSSGGTEASNTISLKVTNQKVKPGSLPRTGSSGVKRFFIVAAMVTITGVTGGSFYFYRIKKELAETKERMNGK